MEETLTPEEVGAVSAAKHKAQLANSEAEKAVALAKLAEAEAKNLVFQLYSKYNLKVGEDQVLSSGKIVRKEPVKPPVKSAQQVMSFEDVTSQIIED